MAGVPRALPQAAVKAAPLGRNGRVSSRSAKMQVPNPRLAVSETPAPPLGAAASLHTTKPRPAPQPHGITWRSIVLGLALSVVHACWVVYEELALLHVGSPTLF